MLLPVGDVPALAKAMARMVRDAGAMDRARIRAEYERRYSRRAVADALEAVYHDALAAQRTTSAATRGGTR